MDDIIKEYQDFLNKPKYTYYVYIRPGKIKYFYVRKKAKEFALLHNKKVKKLY
jgi:hypothetical protein